MKTANKPVIGIIGGGNVGSTLGKKWAKAGYKVYFSSRHPDKLKALAAEAGNHASAVEIAEAAKLGDIVVLAVPFNAEPALSKEIGELVKGKIVLNCDNAFPFRDGELAKTAVADGVAYYSSRHFFPQVKMARAFNSIPMKFIEEAKKESPINVPVAADDKDALKAIEELIYAADGVPVESGNLKSSREFDYHG